MVGPEPIVADIAARSLGSGFPWVGTGLVVAFIPNLGWSTIEAGRV